MPSWTSFLSKSILYNQKESVSLHIKWDNFLFIFSNITFRYAITDSCRSILEYTFPPAGSYHRYTHCTGRARWWKEKETASGKINTAALWFCLSAIYQTAAAAWRVSYGRAWPAVLPGDYWFGWRLEAPMSARESLPSSYTFSLAGRTF